MHRNNAWAQWCNNIFRSCNSIEKWEKTHALYCRIQRLKNENVGAHWRAATLSAIATYKTIVYFEGKVLIVWDGWVRSRFYMRRSRIFIPFDRRVSSFKCCSRNARFFYVSSGMLLSLSTLAFSFKIMTLRLYTNGMPTIKDIISAQMAKWLFSNSSTAQDILRLLL